MKNVFAGKITVGQEHPYTVIRIPIFDYDGVATDVDREGAFRPQMRNRVFLQSLWIVSQLPVLDGLTCEQVKQEYAHV